jgi:hypothetical protein
VHFLRKRKVFELHWGLRRRSHRGAQDRPRTKGLCLGRQRRRRAQCSRVRG